MRDYRKVRMKRLFGNGRCLDVAIDHGVCNEPSFLDGLENVPAVVKALVDAKPDAIQMNYGQADLLQDSSALAEGLLNVRESVEILTSQIGIV